MSELKSRPLDDPYSNPYQAPKSDERPASGGGEVFWCDGRSSDFGA
jgi:hypothetical protein